MPLQLVCPGCQKAYQVPEAAAGRYVRCPAGHVLAVPDLDRTWTVPDEPTPTAQRGGLGLILVLLGLLILASSGVCLYLLLGERAGEAGIPRAEPAVPKKQQAPQADGLTANVAVKVLPPAVLPREDAAEKAESPSPKAAPQVTSGRLDRLDREKLDFRTSAEDARRPTPAVWDGHTNHVRRVAFTDDGQFVVSVSGDLDKFDRPTDNSIRVWDARTGKQVHKLEAFTEPLCALSISPGGRYALFGHGGHWEMVEGKRKYIRAKTHGVFLWDIQAKQMLGPGLDLTSPGQGGGGPRFHGLEEGAFSTGFAPGGKEAISPRVLAAGAAGGLALWETATGDVVFHRKVERIRGFIDGICQAQFTPDGRCLVLAHSDYTLRIVRADNGDEVCPPLESHQDIIWALDVGRGPDGSTRILSAGGGQSRKDGTGFDPGARDYAIRLWDFDRKEILRTFEGHTNNVAAVAFCPDGRHFVSGGRDKTVRLWDLETGKQVRVLGRHAAGVLSVAVSPDGRSCVSGGFDCKVRFWQLPTE